MGSASRYWRLVRIDASGQRRVEEIEAARVFFQRHLSDEQLDDALIQQELLRLYKGSTEVSNSDRHLAGCCLRCFISQQIEQVCVQLESRFGSQHGFSRRDLFPFVLTDEGDRGAARRTMTAYRSLALDIIDTFEPSRSDLGAWTARQVRHHRELNRFLQERGVHLITDWAILNDTKLKQLRQILSEFYRLTPIEVEQACALLEIYHEVYREARRQQIQENGGNAKERCIAPTEDQLKQMSQFLQEEANLLLSSAGVLNKLQTLATQIRRYRIYKRGGGFLTDSFDQPEIRMAAEGIQTEEDDDESADEFLTFYREQLLQCLDQAIAQATTERCTYLQGKKGKNLEKSERFLTALRLLHCHGLSMAEIALQTGSAEYQVIYLLKLKEFRGLVRQRLLGLLGDRILDKAKLYANPQRLQELDRQLEAALEEQIAELMKQAEQEMFTGNRNSPPRSLFACRVCHTLCPP